MNLLDTIQTQLLEQVDSNLRYEQKVLQLQSELVGLKKQYETKMAVLSSLHTKQSTIAQRYSLANIVHLMKEAIAELEEQSDVLSEKYNSQVDSNKDKASDDEDREDDGDSDDNKAKKKKKDNNKLTLESFSTKYIAIRSKIHVLKAQKERLMESHAHASAHPQAIPGGLGVGMGYPGAGQMRNGNGLVAKRPSFGAGPGEPLVYLS